VRLKDPEALSQAKSSSWVEPERFSEDFNGDAGGFEECFVVSAAIQSKDFGLKFALGQGGCKDCELAFSSGLVECWDNECDSSQLMELRQQVTAGWGPARRFFTGAMLLTATQKGKVRASGRMWAGESVFAASVCLSLRYRLVLIIAKIPVT
jgi:hypothetical protein